MERCSAQSARQRERQDSMNNISLVGRITVEPELKQTQKGISVTSFSIAVDRPGSQDTTDFIPVVAWRQTAEFVCKYFRKGQRIGLTGKLTSRKYEDRDGNKRTAYEVVADRVEFVESKPKADGLDVSAEPVATGYGGFTEVAVEEIAEDDLPF